MEMDVVISIVASVVGTALFGLLFHLLSIRKNRIKHFKINSYEIGKGLMDEFPNIKLLYKKKEIVNNFTVLKGGFINTGRGIEGDNIKFDMILPKECRIMDVKIKSSSSDLKIIHSYKENIIHLKVKKQYLKNDSFLYSAVVESNEEINELHDKLSFNNRMINTKMIMSVDLTKKIKAWIYFLFFIILAVSVFTFTELCREKIDSFSDWNLACCAALVFMGGFICAVVLMNELLPKHKINNKIS